MILCRFNIPWYDNDGQARSQVHKLYRQELLKTFEGFTHYDAKGEWYDKETGKTYPEMVTVYDVAVDDASELLKLKNFALRFGGAMGQKAIFFANIGNAVIIPLGEEVEETSEA